MSFMDLDILSKMYLKQELGTDSNYFFLQSYSYKEIFYNLYCKSPYTCVQDVFPRFIIKNISRLEPNLRYFWYIYIFQTFYILIAKISFGRPVFLW